MDNDREFIVIVDDRLWVSLIKDAWSIGSLLAAIAVGVWIESTALQWIAGLLWITIMVSKAAAVEKKRLTIHQAKSFLTKLESSPAQDE